MSAARTSARLVRCYPRAWRDRYGPELEALIVESSGGERVSWATRIDVVAGGGRERLRAGGLATGGVPPAERVRAGALVVLCAWAVFVVAGAAVQKLSEQWQDAIPAARRALASGAFHGLVLGALVASVLVLVGIAAALPAVVAFLRAGGWPAIRRRVAVATGLTVVTAVGTAALVVWAHALPARARNGHDLAYGIAASGCALAVVGSLLAWTAAAVAAARRLRLSPATLALEARLAAAVTLAMGAMTAATAIWWAALAHAAPWFLAGRPVGAAASPLAPTLLVAAALMLAATSVAGAGATHATRAARRVAGGAAD